MAGGRSRRVARPVSVAALVGPVVVSALAGLLVACNAGPTAPPTPRPTGTPGPDGTAVTEKPIRYVALGDSYTIGTSVSIDARWPDQLVAALGPEPATLQLVANLAVNGYTSRDVVDLELPQLGVLEPGFVSLLVGVNDVVQGVPETTYRRNVGAILGDLVARVGAERVLVVTTPDYTVTPAGADYGDPAEQAAGIRAFNAALTELAEDRGILVVDIHDISLGAASNGSLVAPDGLHPSGAQYALWVERIAPSVERLIAPP